MNGVKPVERSPSAGLSRIGPGSEKRTRFWVFCFLLGVFAELHEDGGEGKA
jgi:hypothetical protein